MPKGKPNTAAKAKKAEKATKPEPKMIDHVVTKEDMVANPELAEKGVVVGETIQIPEDAIVPGEDDNNEDDDDDDDSSEDDASVYKDNGEFVRTYSKSVHGKDFKKLAKEFASKISGSVK